MPGGGGGGENWLSLREKGRPTRTRPFHACAYFREVDQCSKRRQLSCIVLLCLFKHLGNIQIGYEIVSMIKTGIYRRVIAIRVEFL